eukprot:scpid97939/ scgid0818/ 
MAHHTCPKFSLSSLFLWYIQAGASAFSSAALLSGERKFTSVMALATDVTPIYQNLSEAMATSTLESPSTYREPVCNVPPLPRRQFTAPAPTAELIPEPLVSRP